MTKPITSTTPISTEFQVEGKRLTPLAAAVVAALSPSGNAVGQEEISGIEEIIVTATKREMSLQDLGQSIEVITTDDIEKQAFAGMEDYMRALPSVSLMNDMPGRNSIVMRGISTGTQEFYTDSQVAVYLDEQPITTISQQVDVRLIDIQRIEVLPGPQGTLFGNSSQAGTLRVITNQPDASGFSSQVGASMWTTSGGDPSWDVNGWVNIPVVADKFAIRAVAYTSLDGGYIDNVLGNTLEGSQDNASVVEDNQNEYKTAGGRIAAKWNISDDWDMDLSYITQEANADGSWGTDPWLGDFKLTKFFKEYRDDNWYQAAATLKGDLGFAELVFNASTFDRDIQYEWDNMVYEQWKDAYWGPYYALYDSDYTFGTIFNDQQVDRQAYELRLTSPGDSRFRWMIGGFYEDSETKWFYGADNPDYVGTTSWYAAQYYAYYYNYLGYDVQYPLPETTIGYSETYDNTISQKAVFGEVGFDIIPDKWNVTVGSRWFEFDRDTQFVQQFPQGLPPAGSYDTGGAYGSSGVDSGTVYKFGTQYYFAEGIMAYALYSEGFRLGGTNSQRAAATGFVPEQYLPDKVENIEIGLKTTLLDNKMQLNVIGFQVDWDDIQTNQSSVDGRWWLRGTINGGKARNRGAEVTVNWQMTDAFYLSTSATFSDPKFTEDVIRITDTIPSGTPMVWSAKRKYSIALDYVINDVLGGDLILRYDYYYEGEKWNDITNAADNDTDGLVPSWDISNAHIGLSLQNGWEAQLSVKNLFDQRAMNSLTNDSSGEFFGDPRFDNIRSYARPRTVGLTVRKFFE